MTTDAIAVTPPPAGDYPVRYSVDYPAGPRDRMTVLFRLILVIPVLVLSATLSGGTGGMGWNAGGPDFRDGDRTSTSRPSDMRSPDSLTDQQKATIIGAIGAAVIAGVLLGPAAFATAMGFGVVAAPLWLATLLMIVFRRKYPRWFFDFTREVARFCGRVGAYAAVQRDEYPAIDEEQSVHLEIDYPDAAQLNRWLPLIKWFLAIPHYIVLFFIFIALVFTTLIAWVAILVTGRYPRSLFDFSVGASRWGARVSGYAFWMVTDRYQPFSLE